MKYLRGQGTSKSVKKALALTFSWHNISGIIISNIS